MGGLTRRAGKLAGRPGEAEEIGGDAGRGRGRARECAGVRALLACAAMDLALLFSEAFPIGSELFELALVSESGGAQADPRGHWRATIRLIVFERVDGDRQVRDIKEQECVWLYPQHREDPRVPAYVAGWAAAVQFIFERNAELVDAGDAGASDRIDTAMPFDFFNPDVLALRRPQTAEDFTDALLSSKKRLGKLLP